MSTRNISINIYWTIFVLLVMDLYIYRALRKTFLNNKWIPFLNAAYLILMALSYTGFYYLYVNFTYKPLHTGLATNLAIGFFFTHMVFRILMMFIFFMEDIYRFIRLLVSFFGKLINPDRENKNAPGRRGFIGKAGLMIASIPFASMIYGITKGKYDFRVVKLKLAFENLPDSFDGFKIVQISDIHSGSFDNREAVVRGIEMVNRQDADLLLFTGDLVNNDSKEIIPYMEDFKKLKAPCGIFSVLGNHDYGDYKQWDSPEAKQDNMELLYQFQESMGFKLLNNENAVITKGKDSICIYGVENWGNPPFPRRGDLDQALSGREDAVFKILMTHDPTHWDKKVVSHPVHIDLTLSGHTHGMQFGVEIPGFKWSPIKYVYPQWAGLYERERQLIYVNRGFGFLGFPGRVGIWPEITLIELTKKNMV